MSTLKFVNRYKPPKKILLGKFHWLTLSEVILIVNGDSKISLDKMAKREVLLARKVLLRFIHGRLPVYGVNTQYGDDAYRVNIDGSYQAYLTSLTRRQQNVIYALSCGMGEEVSERIVRATLLLRVQALAQGVSGIDPELIEMLIALLRCHISPLIYRYGSVGASGDLIPLSSIALTLTGRGKVRLAGKILSAKKVLKQCGIKPRTLQMKEGLSIVNGTSFSTAIAALAIYELCYLLPLSIAASATVAEVMLAMDSSYEPFVHKIKHHSGQIKVAQFVKECWEKSSLIRSLDELRKQWHDSLLSHGKATQEHVQDFYSLRSIAHGFGPFYENLERAVQWIEEEINSANDNPVIDVKNRKIHHGANFLTDYVAVISDQLRADVAKASTWMHALLGNLIHPRKNRGLPSNLMRDPNKYTGFKTLQLLVASLAIHNRNRSFPISSVMLPTEGDNQDVVSLGTHSAFDFLEVTENYARITAIMFFAVAQAIDIRGVKKASTTARKIRKFVRKTSPFLDKDRPLGDELKILTESLRSSNVIDPWFLR